MGELGLVMLVLVCRFVPILPFAFVAYWFVFGLLCFAAVIIVFEIVFKFIERIEKRLKK